MSMSKILEKLMRYFLLEGVEEGIALSQVGGGHKVGGLWEIRYW